MKKFSELHKVWKEAVMLHEVYRRLGFKADDIYMLPAHVVDASRALLWRQTNDGDLCVMMVVKAQGLEYSGCIGPIPCADDRIEAQWKEAIEAFNGGDEKELTRAWRSSLVASKMASVAFAMRDKGFVLPYENERNPNLS